MNPHTNGTPLIDDPEEVAAVPDQSQDPSAEATGATGTGTPQASKPIWPTRTEALKSVATTRKPILLLGGGLAAAVVLFAITTFVGRTPHKKVLSTPQSSTQTGGTPKPKGSVTPLMDAVHNPAQSDSSGQLTPADIKRTKGNSGSPGQPSSPPVPPPRGATLASVPPFDSTQQHWEEPRPYEETRPPAQTAPAQQNLLKEASLVFVKKNEPTSSPTATGTTNGLDTYPALDIAPGTRIRARLETQVSSAVTAPVVAVVEYTYSLGDHLVIPAGARVYGQLQQADRSGAVSIKFNEIEFLDGNREKIEAIGASLEMGPIKGVVSGKNTGRNFLVRTASGIGSLAAMVVGNNTSSAFSEDDLIRQRIAENVGNAGDTEIMNMALTNRVVVSVSADTPLYIVFTKRDEGASSSHRSGNTAP